MNESEKPHGGPESSGSSEGQEAYRNLGKPDVISNEDQEKAYERPAPVSVEDAAVQVPVVEPTAEGNGSTGVATPEASVEVRPERSDQYNKMGRRIAAARDTIFLTAGGTMGATAGLDFQALGSGRTPVLEAVAAAGFLAVGVTGRIAARMGRRRG